MSQITIRPALALAASLLASCSTVQTVGEIEQRARDKNVSAYEQTSIFERQAADARRQLGANIDRPWIVGKAQPLARDVTLPPALRARVNSTLLYTDGAVDLTTVAQRIYQATGIPVRINPDALLPYSAFAPRLTLDGNVLTSDATAPLPTADTIVPAIGALGAVARVSGPQQRAVPLVFGDLPQGQAPLSTVLDAIAIKLGIYWRYNSDLAAIELYRTESRSFNIRALAQATETELELGLTGQGGGNANAGGGQFASRNRSTIKGEAQDSPLHAVVAKLTQFLTKAGSVQAPEGAANTIVVTDTPESLDKVAAFIDRENKALTRRVRIHLQEVTIQRDDTGQAGIEWQALFNSGGRGNTAELASLAGLLDSTKSAGVIGAAVGSGPWAGSGVNISALSELGRIVRQTDYSLLVLNRRSGTFASRDTFSYIKNLEQTQSSSNVSGPTVTVSQEDETVGTFLTMVPDAQDDGQVLLTVAYDNTRLVSLEKQQFGDPNNPSFVQQPRINGGGNVQQVELRPGVPSLIAGTTQSVDTYTRRRLDKDAPLLTGGSDATSEQQLVTLLIVTAIPEEGL